MDINTKLVMDDRALETLLRSNLSLLIGKVFTIDDLDQISIQIVESIRYQLNDLQKNMCY